MPKGRKAQPFIAPIELSIRSYLLWRERVLVHQVAAFEGAIAQKQAELNAVIAAKNTLPNTKAVSADRMPSRNPDSGTK